MTARGVHFALDREDEKRVLEAAKEGEDALFDFITADLEERWDGQWLVESDKAWSDLHDLLAENETLATCILGGEPLSKGEMFIVSYLTAPEARAVHERLEDCDESWLRGRCDTDLLDEFPYLWSNFMDIQTFFATAAEAERAVIFTAAS